MDLYGLLSATTRRRCVTLVPIEDVYVSMVFDFEWQPIGSLTDKHESIEAATDHYNAEYDGDWSRGWWIVPDGMDPSVAARTHRPDRQKYRPPA